MRRSTWICLDDCQAPFVAHLQSPWGASGKPRSWRRFPDKRYRGPTGATRSTVYLPSLSHSSRPTVPPSLYPWVPSLPTHDGITPPMQRQRQRQGQGSDDGDDARRNERWRRGRHQRRTRPPYWITLVNFCAEAVWIFSPCAEGSSSRLVSGIRVSSRTFSRLLLARVIPCPFNQTLFLSFSVYTYIFCFRVCYNTELVQPQFRGSREGHG